MAVITHPDQDRLLSLQLGELDDPERGRIETHLRACESCRDDLTLLAETVALLGRGPEEDPPADGLERVLTAIGQARSTTPSGNEWLRPALASLAGVATGGFVIYAAGTWLAALPSLAQLPLLEPFRVLSGYGLAAFVFFGVGSFVTLALAPMLLLDRRAQGRSLAGG